MDTFREGQKVWVEQADGSQRAGTDGAADPGELWRPLRERYALIVIDAPSLEESHLGLALARHSDATVVVVRADTVG